jgi:hypothetical protein
LALKFLRFLSQKKKLFFILNEAKQVFSTEREGKKERTGKCNEDKERKKKKREI